MNIMQNPLIEKVTINIGVGEAGEKLTKAKKVIELLTNQKPVQTFSKTVNREFGIRKFMPIGCKITLRKNLAISFLKKALSIRNFKIPSYSFDKQGNMSFGIQDYTDFEGIKYNPEIGIFGIDVNVVLKRPGHRISNRSTKKSKLPKKQYLTKNESISFLTSSFGVQII